jgi:NAD+ synthase (glutamine-hydrolysing)
MEDVMRQAVGRGVQIIVFPELSITAYTCLDLFASQRLLDAAEEALLRLVANTAGLDLLAVAGAPLRLGNRLINAAVVFRGGEILGVVPKTYLPNSREFQEQRWFSSAADLSEKEAVIGGRPYPMAGGLLFASARATIGVEICEDLWAPVPPGSLMAMAGAEIICNLSASNELTGKHSYRRSLVAQQSARCIAGYVYAAAGAGESTTDLVFAGGSLIAENGIILREAERFSREDSLITADIDLHNLRHDRRVNRSFMQGAQLAGLPRTAIPFELPKRREELKLDRRIDPHPFVPSGAALDERCEEIFNIQIAGLAGRMQHIRAESAVVGVSGGLDSTLALLVTAMTFDALHIPRSRIQGITMPGFGTTSRTYENAVALIRSLGLSLREIPIREACLRHFADIGHDPAEQDVVYENTQARERTQILMDIANRTGGLVVGTGDLSELALGWATFNGDHISMYGVNAGIPKTLVRYLVEWIAANRTDEDAARILTDIAATPISPELIPADENDGIVQKTEELVGPYELHDFFLYHFLRYGATPARIAFLAGIAFEGLYDAAVIRQWLQVFFRRFFAQQYKRNCLPDGPKVGSISISPRGDWRMASDASAREWLKEL